jgi:hypothetical protein
MSQRIKIDRPRYALTFEPLPTVDFTKAVRALLKQALRQHGLRCVGLSAPNRRSDPMNDNELAALRRYASAARSRGGFGIPFLKCDGNTGAWKAGKNGTDMSGRQLVADVPDSMVGFQKFENNKPVYVIGRVADGYQPPDRDTLGDSDPSRWGPGGKDPVAVCRHVADV